MTESHLVDLEREHHAIELEIEAERSQPACDTLRLAELKRRKLRLKEEIEKKRREDGRAA